MSRDVITVGSTMRISLLYRGEYSQWRERFMNYLEEQTDGEAMINSIQNGDQPLPVIAPEGHFVKYCKKAKIKDYNYYKTKMLLAKKDSDEQVLLAKDQAWMDYSSDFDQKINANMVFMAQIKKVFSYSDEHSSSAEETIAEIMKSSTTNVKTSINEEVFHEVSESIQGESSSSLLNDDFQQSSEEVGVPSSNTQSISSNMIPNLDEWTKDHPLHKIIGDSKLSVRTRGQLANSYLFSCLLSSIEPVNVAEALRDADWALQCGYSQQECIDYDETFALVARIDAIRLFLAYVSHKDFTVFQVDVKTAFLNGILKEEVYIGQPSGFVSKQYPDHVYALDKALYGLK
nr:hypothetical protein [Tanacetum cinerariifolium]